MNGSIKVAELAEITGISARTIQHWCRTGAIPADRVGPRTWAVDISALEARGDNRMLVERVWSHRNAGKMAGW